MAPEAQNRPRIAIRGELGVSLRPKRPDVGESARGRPVGSRRQSAPRPLWRLSRVGPPCGASQRSSAFRKGLYAGL